MIGENKKLGSKLIYVFNLTLRLVKVSIKLIKPPTAKTKASGDVRKNKLIRERTKLIGKIILQSSQKIAKSTKKKLVSRVSAAMLSSVYKEFMEREKIISYDLKRGAKFKSKKVKVKNINGAKISFLSMIMIYSS